MVTIFDNIRVKSVGFLLKISAFTLLIASLMPVRAQTVSISTSGTPSYAKQITMPPGIAGMTPNVALLYSGSEVNGPVGRGWTIQGISTITRCPSTKFIDGAARAVTYGVNDKLCLDGQRLIQTDADGVVINGSAVADPDHPFQTGDAAGGDGFVREYRTEKDIYARIRAYGKAGGDGANGPLYFRVWTKAGQLYEYGAAGDADANAAITINNKVVAWAVSRIFDNVGNHMDFQYEQRDVAWGTALTPNSTAATPGHEWNLLEIRYTGHGTGQPPVNRVVFEYSDRADTPGRAQDRGEAYHMGQKNVSVRRLDAISTYINWPAGVDPKPATAVKVKTFKLSYENGLATGRSRLKKITECTGVNDAVCLAPVTFNYADGSGLQYTQNANFAAGGLAGLPMQSASGDTGVLLGNFFGSGRTDILRWSENPAQNQLFRSDGNGNFTQIPSGTGAGSFNITDQLLFKANGCYSSVAADFNGDGATDILRTMKSSSSGVACGAVQNILYISNGDGSFTPQILDGMDFSQTASNRRTLTQCAGENLVRATQRSAVLGSGSAQPPHTNVINCPEGYVYLYSQTAASGYHLLDVNNDGLLDIVTTITPAYTNQETTQQPEVLCADIVCTRVYIAQVNGTFIEKTDSNLRNHSVYGNPLAAAKNFKQRPFVGDINGDGMADIVADTGVWYSRGDGNFDYGGGVQGTACDNMLDLNGDGRSDCILSIAGDWPGGQSALVANGTGSLIKTNNFNLNTSGLELGSYVPGTSVQNMGFITADIDGDGRGDILRWSDNPQQNTVYLSNGDGTFRIGDFNLTQSDNGLQKSDGSLNFVIGDFTGQGQIEILRTVNGPNGTLRNVLYQKTSPTPPDQLVSAVSSSGLATTLNWASLTAANAPYYSDFADKTARAKYPVKDVNIPMQVVTSMTSDTGVGTGTLTTSYLYAGLKLAYDGRGWMGFREMRTQTPTLNNRYLTVLTEFEQEGVNTGAALLTRTWLGDIWGSGDPQWLSNTYNIYCDKTSPIDAETNASSRGPCYSAAKVRRPYLYMTQQQGWDLDDTPLPTVSTVNTFNDTGDVVKIVNTTAGDVLGQKQMSVKTTDNTYYANNTADDKWIMGRLKTAKVTAENRVAGTSQGLRRASAAATRPARPDIIDVLTAAEVRQKTSTAGTVTNNIGRIATSPGAAPYATATKGVAYTVKIAPTPLKLIGTAAGKVSGTLTATVAGGIAPYQYRWSLINGSKSSVSSNTIANPVVSATLALGDNVVETWLLTVTDAANSVISATVPVTLAVPAAALTVKIAPSPLQIDANDPGDAFASLLATPAGGIAPYTYSWTRSTGSRSSVDTSTIANPVVKATVATGDSFTEQWKVTVTDTAAKTAVASVNVAFTAPALLSVPLTATRSVTAVAATGIATSALSVTPTGGRAPYTYNWERITGTRSTVSNAALSNPVVSLSMTAGEIVTETWQVTVKDAVGHTKTASTAITFNNPAAAMNLVFSPSPFKVDANDPGLASGVLTATPSGGVAPFTYAWTRTTGTRTSVSNATVPNPVVSATLVAGDSFSETWKLTITDSAAKTYAESVSVTFTAPAVLAVPLTATRTSTASATTGIATSALSVTPTGGRAPYTYNWERISGSRSTVANPAVYNPVVSISMSPGETLSETWRVTVTDAVGHTQAASTAITFNYPAPAMGLTFAPSPFSVAAKDPGLASGVLAATATGGVPPYSYAWSRVSGTRTSLSNLTVPNPVVSATLVAADSFSESWKLTITDSTAKTYAENVTVSFNAPATLVATMGATRTMTASATTEGVAAAAFSVTPSGGRSPYTYSWARTSGSRSTAAAPDSASPGISAVLSVGETIVENWTVTLTDSVGHQTSATTTITFTYPAPALTVSFSPVSPLRLTGTDPGPVSAVMTAVPKGGIPPYTYAWARSSGTKTTLSNTTIANPTVSATLINGETSSDVWAVTVKDTSGKSTTASITVTETLTAVLKPTLSGAVQAADATDANGGLSISPLTVVSTGGTGGNTYQWTRMTGSRSYAANPTSTSPSIRVAMSLGERVVEDWQVAVTDDSGHTATVRATLTFEYPGAALALTFAPNPIRIAADDPGPVTTQLNLTVKGGVAPYRYSWARTAGTGTGTLSDTTIPNPIFSGTAVTGTEVYDTWRVTVTDTFGTVASATTTTYVSAPALLTASLTATRTATATDSTKGVASAVMTVTPAGGRAPYTYAWSRVAGSRAVISDATDSNPSVTATVALNESFNETWQVVVRDAAGHSIAKTTVVTFTYPPRALDTSYTVSGFGQQSDPGTYSGTINLTVTGGVAPYSYSWYTSSTTTPLRLTNGNTPNPTITSSLDFGQSFYAYWYCTITDSVGKTFTTPAINQGFSVVKALTAQVYATDSVYSVTIPATGTGKGQLYLQPLSTGGVTPLSYSWSRVSGDRTTAVTPTARTTYVSAVLSNGETIVETWQLDITDAVGHTASAQQALTFKRAAAAKLSASDGAASEASGAEESK